MFHFSTCTPFVCCDHVINVLVLALIIRLVYSLPCITAATLNYYFDATSPKFSKKDTFDNATPAACVVRCIRPPTEYACELLTNRISYLTWQPSCPIFYQGQEYNNCTARGYVCVCVFVSLYPAMFYRSEDERCRICDAVNVDMSKKLSLFIFYSWLNTNRDL